MRHTNCLGLEFQIFFSITGKRLHPSHLTEILSHEKNEHVEYLLVSITSYPTCTLKKSFATNKSAGLLVSAFFFFFQYIMLCMQTLFHNTFNFFFCYKQKKKRNINKNHKKHGDNNRWKNRFFFRVVNHA